MANYSSLPELRNKILDSCVSLIKMIDTYSVLKSTQTGSERNTISEFRSDAYTIALAAATETMNPDDGTCSERDTAKAKKLLADLGVN